MVVAVLSILARRPRPKFRSYYDVVLSSCTTALLGQLRSLLAEVFESKLPLQGVLLQCLFVRGTYCNPLPISRSDDIKN